MIISLRDKITNIIGDFAIDTSLTAEQRADKIINLFEELINEKIHKIEDNPFTDVKVGILLELKKELSK